jgi:hypothetical protein
MTMPISSTVPARHPPAASSRASCRSRPPHDAAPDRRRDLAARRAAQDPLAPVEPIQIVPTTSGVKPTNQTSAASCVVPVLPAAGPRNPRAHARAGAAVDHVLHHGRRRNAVAGSMTRRALGCCAQTVRRAVRDARHEARLGRCPSVANAA